MTNLGDAAAERGVISGVIRHGAEVYLDICDIVTPRTMTVDSNQHIWACLNHIFKDSNAESVDLPTLLSAANSLGLGSLFEKKEEMEHLRGIFNFPSNKDSVRRLAGRIRKLEVSRLLEEQVDVAKANVQNLTGDESIEQILLAAEQPIFDFSSLLTNVDSSGPRLMGEGALEYLEYLMDNPREMMGISTGMPRFDKAIGGGLRGNSVDVVAARLKQGKSFLVDNVATFIAGTYNIPVLNVDTEMTWEEHLHRVTANMAGVETEHIETGKCGKNPTERKRIVEAATRLKGMPYHYDCVIGKPFEDVLASLRRWVTRTVGINKGTGKANPCVIIYDYIKMMSGETLSSDLKEYQALGFVTTALKNFMGRYSIACLAFAQLNRDGIDSNDTSAVGGSDRIAQYGTSLTYYKRKDPEEIAEAGATGKKFTHKLIPVASRHGRGLDDPEDYINIQAEYQYGRITEGPTRNELQRLGGGSAPKGIIINEPGDSTSVPFNA